MTDRHHNPFQGIDLFVPLEFHEWLDRYSQTGSGRAIVDHSPFPRMVDCWFLAVCIAFRLRLDPQEMRGRKRVKIIDGQIFASDPWRIYALMLIAVEHTGDVEIVADPRRVIEVVSGLAMAGLPEVVDMLRRGAGEPIWNLSESMREVLVGNGKE